MSYYILRLNQTFISKNSMLWEHEQINKPVKQNWKYVCVYVEIDR